MSDHCSMHGPGCRLARVQIVSDMTLYPLPLQTSPSVDAARSFVEFLLESDIRSDRRCGHYTATGD